MSFSSSLNPLFLFDVSGSITGGGRGFTPRPWIYYIIQESESSIFGRFVRWTGTFKERRSAYSYPTPVPRASAVFTSDFGVTAIHHPAQNPDNCAIVIFFGYPITCRMSCRHRSPTINIIQKEGHKKNEEETPKKKRMHEFLTASCTYVRVWHRPRKWKKTEGEREKKHHHARDITLSCTYVRFCSIIVLLRCSSRCVPVLDVNVVQVAGGEVDECSAPAAQSLIRSFPIVTV